MKILLDTNFILTCVKWNIDFDSRSNEIIDEDIEWIVPLEVLDELKFLKNRAGVRGANKESAGLGLDIVKNLGFKAIELGGKNPNVDMKIVDYINGKNIVLATMDKKLKSRVDNKILTIRGKNNLEIV